MKVSIIYHVYKEYTYLKESLDSILNQTDKNYELILICDSPDENAYEILDTFSFEKNSKVKIIKFIENFGKSFAYNFALDKISGEYVYFAESRSVLEPNFVSRILETIKENNNYDYISFLSSKNIVKELESKEINKLDENDLNFNIVNCKLTIKDKVFRKNFLLENKIEFIQYKTFHSLFMFNVFQHFNCSYFLNEHLITWKRNPKLGYEYNLYNILESAEILSNILNNEVNDDSKREIFRTWIPIMILYEFVRKMYLSYPNNEKIVTKSIYNAMDLIDRIEPNYKKNKYLDLLLDKKTLKYLKEFKRNLSYVRKNIK